MSARSSAVDNPAANRVLLSFFMSLCPFAFSTAPSGDPKRQLRLRASDVDKSLGLEGPEGGRDRLALTARAADKGAVRQADRDAFPIPSNRASQHDEQDPKFCIPERGHDRVNESVRGLRPGHGACVWREQYVRHRRFL